MPTRAGKRDPRDFALWKGWKKETEPETAAWPSPWGPRPAGLAHRVLGDGRQVPRPGVRHPRRRRGPPVPPPRERAGPVPGGRTAVRVVLDAQRLDHHRRREDEQVARQLVDHPGGARELPRHRAALLPGRRALPQSHVEFSFEALDEAANGVPADRELPRPRPAPSSRASCRAAFVAAMDDDLGTPAAVAVLFDVVRDGNRADDPTPQAAQVAGDARRPRPEPGRPGVGSSR